MRDNESNSTDYRPMRGRIGKHERKFLFVWGFGSKVFTDGFNVGFLSMNNEQ